MVGQSLLFVLTKLLLRDASLFTLDSSPQPQPQPAPGALFTPPLPAGTGNAIDLEAAFVLSRSTGSTFGLAVLADPHGLHLS